MTITNVRGGRGRFDGCTTTEQMVARLYPSERLVKSTYDGRSQIEVRRNANPTGSQWDNGARGIVATAEIVS